MHSAGVSFCKKWNGAFWRARALGGRQPAVLLRLCLSPFHPGSIEFFGWKTGAGLADEAAGRSPAGEENTAGRLFGITKTVFPFVHRGYYVLRFLKGCKLLLENIYN